jgi:hypothetical protein
MGVRNDGLGGTDWGSENVTSTDLNDTFDKVVSVLPPIGAVMAWLKSYTNTPALPAGWVECNGQTLSDADSVYNGQVIPNLNSANRFLRGNTTSGSTGGAETHSHQTGGNRAQVTSLATTGGFQNDTGNYTKGMVSTNHLPPYMTVVWIMRVK